MEKARIRAVELVKTGKDTPKMLDFADKTLNQVSLTVQPFVVLTQEFGALMRRNHRLNASIQQIFDEMGRRVAPVSNQSLEFESLQQVMGLSNVVTLPSGQAETQGIAQSDLL